MVGLNRGQLAVTVPSLPLVVGGSLICTALIRFVYNPISFFYYL